MNNRKMKAVGILIVMIMVSVSLLNCKGDDGAVGPMGNANVIYSDWEVGKLFADSTVDNSLVRVTHIAAPKLTLDIMNEGTVLVYMNYGAGPMQLPYTSYAGGKISTISHWIGVGKIIPYRFTHDNSNSVNLSAFLQYRYIILPGNTPAIDTVKTGGRRAAPESLDYYEVCKFYGIPL